MTEEKFELETNTIWSFPNRGKWATHDAKYRGNFSPYIAKNIILRYSNENDLVLDQFVGGGTTLIECKLNNRNAIGIDINPNAVKITKNKLNFNCDNDVSVDIKLGNACFLDLENESIDLICTHPPYADIIKYSERIDGDLSHLKYKDFLVEVEKVANECYRVLKKDKFCAIVMGDTRKNGMVQPLGFEVMQRFINAGFKQKEIIIKEQHNCKATGFWKTNSQKYNFLLLAHEYIFIFKK
ncbi:TRM11 family SAM-dependent methyltransferase [Campylobacter vicugnae]|uniref:TRM11 family SAM-dependent methyltransferase n=1 Tax=Campylobacter vicugnae TaxID=1660076 RepID=UPI00254A3294|nr:DNA methyltransferase [Campylobacter ovis]MDL0095228.1 DNA methyltransferase [Campylobacter ovis]